MEHLQVVNLDNGDIMLWDWGWANAEDYLLIPKDDQTSDKDIISAMEKGWAWDCTDEELNYLLKVIKAHCK